MQTHIQTKYTRRPAHDIQDGYNTSTSASSGPHSGAPSASASFIGTASPFFQPPPVAGLAGNSFSAGGGTGGGGGGAVAGGMGLLLPLQQQQQQQLQLQLQPPQHRSGSAARPFNMGPSLLGQPSLLQPRGSGGPGVGSGAGGLGLGLGGGGSGVGLGLGQGSPLVGAAGGGMAELLQHLQGQQVGGGRSPGFGEAGGLGGLSGASLGGRRHGMALGTLCRGTRSLW